MKLLKGDLFLSFSCDKSYGGMRCEYQLIQPEEKPKQSKSDNNIGKMFILLCFIMHSTSTAIQNQLVFDNMHFCPTSRDKGTRMIRGQIVIWHNTFL